MNPIITEDVLRRYLVARNVEPAEVARVIGLGAELEHKIAEGFWCIFAESDGSLKQHEYHAALAGCAVAEMVSVAYGDTGREGSVLRQTRERILAAAGLTTTQWYSAR